MITHDILNILACPLCKGELSANLNEQILYCHTCKRSFPVIEGIPVMMVDKMTPLAT
ncbi:MAG: Trm112 family protein [Desulfuromonadales bacterium]